MSGWVSVGPEGQEARIEGGRAAGDVIFSTLKAASAWEFERGCQVCHARAATVSDGFSIMPRPGAQLQPDLASRAAPDGRSTERRSESSPVWCPLRTRRSSTPSVLRPLSIPGGVPNRPAIGVSPQPDFTIGLRLADRSSCSRMVRVPWRRQKRHPN